MLELRSYLEETFSDQTTECVFCHELVILVGPTLCSLTLFFETDLLTHVGRELSKREVQHESTFPLPATVERGQGQEQGRAEMSLMHS